jgi:DNA-binding beta-propeller fold protein YncE
MNLRKFASGCALAVFATSAWAQGILGVNGGGGAGFSASGAVVSINPTTGAGTVLSTPIPGIGLTGVATDASGNVYAVTGTFDSAGAGPRLLRINPVTGAVLQDVGRLQTAAGDDCYTGDLSFQPGTNVLFGILGNQGPNPRCGIAGSPGGYLIRINTTTAQVTVVGRDPSIENANGGLAFAPNGTLYFTPCWNNNGNIHTLNPATAAVLSTVALAPVGVCYMGLASRPADGAIFASYDDENADNNIYILNPATGARTLVGNPGNFLVHDLTFVGAAPPLAAFVPVPTMSPWALIALAAMLASLGVAAMRRHKRA